MVGVCVVLLALALPGTSTVQRPIDAPELAEYRLTAEALERFARATRLIVTATRDDQRFDEAPLFSKDITVSGDAVEAAAILQRRLEAEPVLAGALFAAEIDAREYAKFALTLFGARLAHGFVQSGALRRVPPGAATDNIAFIEIHKTAIRALLRQMDLE
jgi:hypothetical protein